MIATMLLAFALAADPAPGSPGVSEPGAPIASDPAAPAPPAKPTEKDLPAWVPWVAGEALIAANSGLATAWPEPVGWVFAIGGPIWSVEAHDWYEYGAAVAGFAGIGLLNALELRKDRYSAGARFGYNVLAWHGFAAAIALADLAGGHAAEREKGRSAAPAVGAAPLRGGAALAVSWRF